MQTNFHILSIAGIYLIFRQLQAFNTWKTNSVSLKQAFILSYIWMALFITTFFPVKCEMSKEHPQLYHMVIPPPPPPGNFNYLTWFQENNWISQPSPTTLHISHGRTFLISVHIIYALKSLFYKCFMSL